MRYLDMGPDIASYLITMHTFFGHDVTGMGLLRPPLIALPLKLFTLALGTLTGAKVLGVLVSVAIGIPFYLLARRICHPWIAVAVSILFVFCPAYSDMLGWGYLTMIAILFILLTFHFLLLVLEKPSRRNVILTGLCASLVVGFHQLSLVYFVILAIVFLMALLAFNRKKLLESHKSVATAVAMAGIFSIPYVPVYIHLLQMEPISRASVSFITIHCSFDNFLQFLGPWSWFWRITLALAIAGMVFLWRQDRSRALLLAAMLLVPVALNIFALPPPLITLNWRAFYLMYIPVWLLAGVALSRLWSWRYLHLSGLHRWLPKVTCIALIAALLPVQIISSQARLHNTLDFSTYLDGTRWQAARWIGQNTEPGATIAVYPNLLGWWIREEGLRDTFDLFNRDVGLTYAFEQERSLVVDRILSRNQGLENGNLRLAMTYPYDGPGSPVLGVYVGGRYYDVLMFDDSQNCFELEGGGNTTLADAQSKTMNILPDDGESMHAVTLYQMEGFNVTRTLTLDRGERAAIICYQIHSGDANITEFNVPIFFNFEPSSVSEVNEHSFQVIQGLMSAFEGIVPVATNVTIDTEGATLEQIETSEQRVMSSFNDISKDATITLHFSTDKPLSPADAPVSHYEVPELIKDYGVDYVVIDLKPPPPTHSDMPWGTEEWFDSCPYYKLVYSQGDIRVYQVIASELP